MVPYTCLAGVATTQYKYQRSLAQGMEEALHTIQVRVSADHPPTFVLQLATVSKSSRMHCLDHARHDESCYMCSQQTPGGCATQVTLLHPCSPSNMLSY